MSFFLFKSNDETFIDLQNNQNCLSFLLSLKTYLQKNKPKIYDLYRQNIESRWDHYFGDQNLNISNTAIDQDRIRFLILNNCLVIFWMLQYCVMTDMQINHPSPDVFDLYKLARKKTKSDPKIFNGLIEMISQI